MKNCDATFPKLKLQAGLLTVEGVKSLSAMCSADSRVKIVSAARLRFLSF